MLLELSGVGGSLHMPTVGDDGASSHLADPQEPSVRILSTRPSAVYQRCALGKRAARGLINDSESQK